MFDFYYNGIGAITELRGAPRRKKGRPQFCQGSVLEDYNCHPLLTPAVRSCHAGSCPLWMLRILSLVATHLGHVFALDNIFCPDLARLARIFAHIFNPVLTFYRNSNTRPE